jgi:hypothetical protein
MGAAGQQKTASKKQEKHGVLATVRLVLADGKRMNYLR